MRATRRVHAVLSDRIKNGSLVCVLKGAITDESRCVPLQEILEAQQSDEGATAKMEWEIE
jgi:hypothetical protein